MFIGQRKPPDPNPFGVPPLADDASGKTPNTAGGFFSAIYKHVTAHGVKPFSRWREGRRDESRESNG